MAKYTFWDLLFSQWTTLAPPLYADLKGKTVVVIGANAGIGFEAVKHFAKMKPARLVLGCRSEERGRKALQEIARATGYVAELELVDLALFSSVQEFATRMGDSPVDILVMNAAVAEKDYARTTDNWEKSIQVNHLSTALVSLLLTPNMDRAAREHNSNSRLVIVSSEVHWWSDFTRVLSAPHLLDTLNSKEYASKPEQQTARYSDSKLLEILFARAFASHLKYPSAVIASTVNPGFCTTDLRRNAPKLALVRMKIMDWVMGRTAEQGSRQLVWAALGPDGKDGPHTQFLQGGYVTNDAVHQPSDFVVSKEGYETQEKLWRETLDILKPLAPGLGKIVDSYF